MDPVQAAWAERVTRQATAERAIAHQKWGKRKVGKRADAEVGITASAVSMGSICSSCRGTRPSAECRNGWVEWRASTWDSFVVEYCFEEGTSEP